MELLRIFIENVQPFDLFITLILMGLVVAVDYLLFTHPKTRDLFTKEK